MIDEKIIYLIIGLILGIYGCFSYINFRKKRRQAFISQRAKIGEVKAKNVLECAGYKIIGSQVQENVVMYIDGEAHESFVRADYLVQKKRKRYVVEVKTGNQADMKKPNVRRQLFEYANLFQVDGILFIDMNLEKIYTIDFENQTRFEHGAAFFIYGMCTAVFIYIFIQSFVN